MRFGWGNFNKILEGYTPGGSDIDEGAVNALIEEALIPLKGQLTPLQEQMLVVKENLGGVQENLETVQGNIGGMKEAIQTVQGNIGGIQENLETVQDDLELVQENIENVSDNVQVVTSLPEVGAPETLYIVNVEGHDTSYHWNPETQSYDTIAGALLATDEEGNELTMIAASDAEVTDIVK